MTHAHKSRLGPTQSAAVRWYERVLGKPADSQPMSEVAEWRLERGGWLQVYQLPERAGAGSFTRALGGGTHALAAAIELAGRLVAASHAQAKRMGA